MAKKRGLGKSLEALLAYGEQSFRAAAETQDECATLSFLPIDQIERSPYQPRQVIDPEALSELADSIRAQGVVQPLVVRKSHDKYEIIAGERRLHAARLAGLTVVPAVIRHVSDHAAMTIALIENIQRENLNAIEMAEAMQKLIDELGLTHQELAKSIGKSRASITNYLRLLSLPIEIKTLLLQKQLEMGHARALIGLPESIQTRLAQQIVEKNLSVRETEQAVKRLTSPALETSEALPIHPDILHVTESLSRLLKLKVEIKSRASGSGKVIIKYRHLDELEKLLAQFEVVVA
ncbi:MAG: hypothetical protein A3F43_03235 [Gammaproteobacteria bacterium RIFCSPHIGHO2_12_FULL_42_10]|nr:MAG: hypothetical protein A3F43_03235 [Gammaproteobacteria bacterium RIFCSPHIGHO2_12_FULL_42_10]